MNIHTYIHAYIFAGRPEGGEAMGMRALFSLIKEKYA
jgi:hypothetical protein